MRVEELVSSYPNLYHMAYPDALQDIWLNGLLSTTAILDRCSVPNGPERAAIESDVRQESIVVEGPGGFTPRIRDNLPMSAPHLQITQHARTGGPVLGDGLTVADWCELLNKRVFFWLSWGRVSRLTSAKAYRDAEQLVFTLNTKSLVCAHQQAIELSPINSGATKPYPTPRDRSTFLPINEYNHDDWSRRRRGVEPIVELTVLGGVRDFSCHVLRAQILLDGEVQREVDLSSL